MIKKLRITVAEKTYDVEVEILSDTFETPIQTTPIIQKTVAKPNIVIQAAPNKPVNQIANANTIQAPLAGIVISINVKIGDAVEAGKSIMTIEAMKMQTPINAPRAGIIKEIFTKPGDAVPEGTPLISLE